MELGTHVDERTPSGHFNPLYDGQGDIIGLVNSSKKVERTFRYGPYGENIKSEGITLRPVLLCVAVISMLGCGVALSGCGSTKTVRINNGSMEPTYHVGALIVFNTGKSTPKIGQVLLFHPPQGASEKEYNPMCGPAPHPSPRGGGAACSAPVTTPATEKFVKRIVAGPGDVISIREGHVTLNGHREPDSYTKPCGNSAECDFPTPIKIPPDHWFAMNDNRGESNDSRSWGPIPTSWIIGHLN